MNEWIQLITIVAVGGLLSLIGGLYMVYGKWGRNGLQQIAVPFAAGALLAAAFLDLLPEALHDSKDESIPMLVLVGFLVFFMLERSFSWFHHHHAESAVSGDHKRTVPLIIISDLFHNFIDGLAIGAAFLVSPATGVIATIAVAAHEVPQEIGDFGLLLARGIKKQRVVLVNIASSLLTVVGATLVFGFGSATALPSAGLLALTAGFFVYIAASDIIPTIHAEPSRRLAAFQTAVPLFAVLFVAFITEITHQHFASV